MRRAWLRIYVDASDVYLGYTWSLTGTKSRPPGTPGTPASWNYYNNNFKPEAVLPWICGRVQAP